MALWLKKVKLPSVWIEYLELYSVFLKSLITFCNYLWVFDTKIIYLAYDLSSYNTNFFLKYSLDESKKGSKKEYTSKRISAGTTYQMENDMISYHLAYSNISDELYQDLSPLGGQEKGLHKSQQIVLGVTSSF